MSLEETQSFFATYCNAFNALDGNAVADLWHHSSGIVDSGGTDGLARLTWWPEDTAMRANHLALCEVYRRNGYAQAQFHIQQHVPMGAHHAFAHVHWQLKREDSSLLQQFHTGYQLMRTAAGPKVVLAVAHQEDIAEMKRHAAQ